ncbi:hypothetical protein Tco_0162362 [Tanacetum coccineum]
MIKAGKLSHLIKEIKQGDGKDQPKAAKKEETSGKDKAMAILMVQPWQKIAKQRITQSFSPDPEILFPPLGEEDGMKGPMIIEAEIGGHFIHRIYNHRKARCEENSSSPINSSQNAEIPGPRRSTNSMEQQDNPAGMRNGLRARSTVFQYRSDHRRKNKITIHPEYPEQTIMIGSTLTEEGQKALCDLLRHNLDIFA